MEKVQHLLIKSHATHEDILRKALATIRQHLDMDVAFISQFRDGQRYFLYVDSQKNGLQILEGASDLLEDSYCQRIVDGRLPELIHDATQNAEALASTRACECSLALFGWRNLRYFLLLQHACRHDT